MKARAISFLGSLAAIGAVCALAVPAAATAANTTLNKPYSLVLAPASVPSGSHEPISATFTNLTSQQQLGSANLTPPADYNVTSAQISGVSPSPAPATATAAVDGNVVKLRGLSLPPGASVTVAMQVAAPCAAGSARWTSIVKQANDFNGPPGNDLTMDASKSSATTTTTGGCQLRFTTQPKDVQVGSTITGIAGNPAGPPVAVTVLDGAGIPRTAAIAVTVGLGTAPEGATLAGTKTVTSVDGVATFGTLSVTKPGIYTLTATSPAAAATESDAFTAHLVFCQNNQFCTATASTSGTVPGTNRPYTNTVRADAQPNPDGAVSDDGGKLSVAFNTGYRPVCDSYSPVSGDQEAILGPNRELTVTSTIAKAVLDARNRSATSLKTCLVAPYQFDLGIASGNGGKAQPLGDVDGDGHQDFVGLLPQCHPVAEDPPCQVSAGPDGRGNGVIVFRLPPDWRDPYTRH